MLAHPDMQADERVPQDCQLCAACCQSSGSRFVPVTGADHARLGEHATRLVEFVGTRAWMRMREGRCVALRRQPDGRWACGVYQQRPEQCRRLERGSGQCLGELWRSHQATREAGR